MFLVENVKRKKTANYFMNEKSLVHEIGFYNSAHMNEWEEGEGDRDGESEKAEKFPVITLLSRFSYLLALLHLIEAANRDRNFIRKKTCSAPRFSTWLRNGEVNVVITLN